MDLFFLDEFSIRLLFYLDIYFAIPVQYFDIL